MKLQQFIQNYQRKNIATPVSRSPEGEHVFKTSQSIGTLNSFDQFVTDRSVVIKEHTFMFHPDSTSVEHLKDLCAVSSRYPSRKVSQQRLLQELVTENQAQTETKDRNSVPYFHNSMEDKQSKSFAKSKRKLYEKMQQISFQAHTEGDQGFLYEQEPSDLYEGYPTQEASTLTQQTLQFMQQYDTLSCKMTQLEQQNNFLEQQLEKSTELSFRLQKQQEQLQQQTQNLHDLVGSTIQETIELQNKIKQLLLRHQLQKYQFVQTKRQALAPISLMNKNKTPF